MAAAFPSPPLPQELREIIVTCLADCPQTLAACAQAHPSLTRLAQSLLFHTISLTSAEHIHAFVRTLRQSPHVALYVRHLLIMQSPPPARNFQGNAISLGASSMYIDSLEGLLPNVEKVALRCSRYYHRTPGMSARNRGSIMMFSAPHGDNTFIARCSQTLRVLELDYEVHGLTDRDFDRSYHLSLPALHTLILGHRSLFTDRTLRACVATAPNVERLVLWTDFTPKQMAEHCITQEGVVDGSSLPPGGGMPKVLLKTAIVDGWPNLKKVELVKYAHPPSSDAERMTQLGDEGEQRLGVLRCTDGREVEVAVVQIPPSRQVPRDKNTPAPLLAFELPSE
ncbi:uncharacterized protein SCHCODRAFT_02644472 [Schizophyllum commune H4-8]|nr:uncharacterized protein SCHCODRAFT_02644472 [Schizophyllum commune H4-8]KAI5885337.1 hypothetical protein SCHCODRAFT_02644472 [Schizophyllum commune H4-8]